MQQHGGGHTRRRFVCRRVGLQMFHAHGIHVHLLLIMVLVLLTTARVEGFCTPEEQQQAMDQDVFYKCVRRMSEADRNGDDRLDQQELSLFLKNFAWSLYVVSPFPTNGTLPTETQEELFEALVNATGSRIDENGNPLIDIYGSNINDMPTINRERFRVLHEICDEIVEAFEEYQPLLEAYQGGTVPPKMMVLENVLDKNEKNGANQEKNNPEEEQKDSNILSVHASFIIVNFEGLEAHAVELELRRYHGVFVEAFEKFLDTLMATECPHDGDYTYQACWEDTDASYDSAYDAETGSLCGSHAEYVRRIFCRELYGNDRQRLLRHPERNLEPRHIIENIVLYKVQDTNCPIPMMSQGEAGSQAPLCQTVYAHYLLHLHDLDVAHKNEIENVYTNVTQTAIHNGMLQDSLREVDPDSVYFVEGTGFRLTPIVHHHEQDGDEDQEYQQDNHQVKHSPYHHTRMRFLKKPCTRFLRGNSSFR